MVLTQPVPHPMARSFDAELAQLESLRDQTREATVDPLRKALGNRNSFLVSKAAKLAADYEHRDLIPDLVAAFPRFADAKSDPQCWAREAIARTLAAFDYQESDLFLAGMRTFQPGFADDTATALRGICALALVNCRDLSSHRVLTLLLPLFADKQLPVRVNAARAVEQIGSDAAALLLRLRAELASDAPELLGACYSGVLRLEGSSAIPWAAKFLNPFDPDEASTEAAFAIADTRSEAAFTLLQLTWKQARDPEFRSTLLTAIALTRQPAAWEFLLDQAAEGSRSAREALENSAPPADIVIRLEALKR